MTIRRKIYLIILSLLTIFFCGQIFISKTVLTKSFESLEAKKMSKNLERLMGFINEDINKLNLIVDDWAHWDECYDFMKTKSRKFISANVISTTFDIIQAQHILFFNNQHQLFFGKSFIGDKLTLPSSKIITSIKQIIAKLAPSHLKSSRGGFIRFDGSILQFSISKIFTSKRQGPARGLLVMAKTFSEKDLSLISKKTLLKADMISAQKSLKRIPPNGIITQNKKSIEGLISVADFYGNPAFMVRGISKNEIVAHGKESIFSLTWYAFFILAAIFILLIVMLEINVIKKIKTIQKYIKDIGDQHTLKKKIPITSNDEMGMLSQTFNRMLDSFDQHNKEKMEMQKKVFQASKLATIGELSEGVGHEINNPLAIVMGNLKVLKTKMIRDGIRKPEYFKLLEKQFYGTERIATIVQGLKSYIQNDEIEDKKININTIIKETLALIQKVYQQKGVNIIINICAKDPIILGKSSAVKQILINLLSNARDAVIETEQKEIMVTTHIIESRVILKVRDYGQGIPQKHQHQIFEPFFTTKGSGLGVGLGLSLAKQMVTNMNGEIDIQSSEQKGTVVTISFPLQQDDIISSGSDASITHSLRGHVLIVDDEDFIREVLKEYLTDFGLTVEFANNGKSGLHMIKTNQYDFIITDLRMPVMSGEEMIEQLQNLPEKRKKIFVITGNMNINLSQFDIAGYLYKPFSKEDIYKLLNSNWK